ncbi:Macro domain-containing protein [Aphelenchoides fujianensis]|nr:Macro domain-containing protein [Aphelenchoides fujianensis]
MRRMLNPRMNAVMEDITKIRVDAIVNAANKTLRGGGGVDGAIHRAAGKELLAECESLGGCEVGEAKLTKAYNIRSAKYIIHTVGPRVSKSPVPQNQQEQLRNCYWNSLEVAKQHNVESIAFPCISTGIYSFPNNLACEIACKTVTEWLEKNPEMKEVIFCCFLDEDFALYVEQLGPK